MTFLLAAALGLMFGFVWASFVLLPLLYGAPRSTLWAVKGLVTWNMPLSCVVGACFWTAVVSGALLLIFVFAPAFGEALIYDGTFFTLCSLTVAWFFLSSLTSRSRERLNRDFVNYALGYLTDKGHAVLQDLVAVRLQQQHEHEEAA
jgi:RsiW-degrading membrane proteinase PrsW (M82 family)